MISIVSDLGVSVPTPETVSGAFREISVWPSFGVGGDLSSGAFAQAEIIMRSANTLVDCFINTPSISDHSIARPAHESTER